MLILKLFFLHKLRGNLKYKINVVVPCINPSISLGHKAVWVIGWKFTTAKCRQDPIKTKSKLSLLNNLQESITNCKSQRKLQISFVFSAQLEVFIFLKKKILHYQIIRVRLLHIQSSIMEDRNCIRYLNMFLHKNSWLFLNRGKVELWGTG